MSCRTLAYLGCKTCAAITLHDRQICKACGTLQPQQQLAPRKLIKLTELDRRNVDCMADCERGLGPRRYAHSGRRSGARSKYAGEGT